MICQNENYQHDHVQTMTSLEIAELTGKQHFHVMEAIRKMEPAWKKVAESNFRLGSYKDAKLHSGPYCALLANSVTQRTRASGLPMSNISPWRRMPIMPLF